MPVTHLQVQGVRAGSPTYASLSDFMVFLCSVFMAAWLGMIAFKMLATARAAKATRAATLAAAATLAPSNSLAGADGPGTTVTPTPGAIPEGSGPHGPGQPTLPPPIPPKSVRHVVNAIRFAMPSSGSHRAPVLPGVPINQVGVAGDTVGPEQRGTDSVLSSANAREGASEGTTLGPAESTQGPTSTSPSSPVTPVTAPSSSTTGTSPLRPRAALAPLKVWVGRGQAAASHGVPGRRAQSTTRASGELHARSDSRDRPGRSGDLQTESSLPVSPGDTLRSSALGEPPVTASRSVGGGGSDVLLSADVTMNPLFIRARSTWAAGSRSTPAKVPGSP